MKIEILEQILKSPYDSDNWKDVLRSLFSGKDVIYSTSRADVVESAKHEIANSIIEIGSQILSDKKIIRFYDVELIQGKHVSKNRVELRNLLHDRIVPGDTDAILVCFHTPSDKDWRLTFISKSIYWDEDFTRQKEETHPKRYTYVLGEDESIRTALNQFEGLFHAPINIKRIIDAFSVEKLNKEFFTQYKKHYVDFWKFVANPTNDYRKLFSGVTAEKQDKAIRDFSKKLLGRIVFLYFLQKKGWMGCSSKSSTWEDGKRQFMQQLFEGFTNQERFHSDCLTKLFFKTLNERRDEDLFFVDGLTNELNNTRVPYLNGGLFENDTPIGIQNINFPAHYFKELLEFLSQYNFTIDENSPDDHEVGIDPEMLGHIFENLLEDNKDKGAFYTPKEIVQYMTQESLIQYLQTHLGEHQEIEAFIRYGNKGDENDKNNFIRNNGSEIEHLLDKVKICDPAIGSGAFPMGMLHEIFRAKMSLDWTLNRAHRAKVKRDIIQNSIYGVDLENGAVDIARLRFWLALVVDEDIPEPLPNLDYKIVQGNSLLESFEGIDLSKIHLEEGKRGDGGNLFSGILVNKLDEEEKLEDLIHDYFNLDDPELKSEKHAEIDARIIEEIHLRIEAHKLEFEKNAKSLRRKIKAKSASLNIAEQKLKYENDSKDSKLLRKINLELDGISHKEIELKKLYESSDRPFFLWHLFFKEVFDEGGFDIVIGNPPYVQLQKMKEEANILSKEKYETFMKTGDLYTLFYEKGLKSPEEGGVLKPGGVLAYITSDKWLKADYGKKTRKFFSKRKPLKLIALGGGIFQTATVNTNILIIRNEETNEPCLNGLVLKNTGDLNFLGKNDFIKLDNLNEDSWIIISQEEFRIKKIIEKKGSQIFNNTSVSMNYGIKTGLNEAFIISDSDKKKILEGDSKSIEIIKPILLGKNIKRYSVNWKNLWLINTHNGTSKIPRVDIEKYPFVIGHLNQFSPQLQKRYDQGATPYHLRNCAYIEEFEKKKIVWGNLATSAQFAIAEAGMYINAPSPIITPGSYFLLGVLNSKLGDWYIRLYGVVRNGGYFEYKPMFVEKLPIPEVSKTTKKIIESLVRIVLFVNQDHITFINTDQRASDDHISQLLEEVIDGCVFELYFEEHMKERGINILDLVKDLIIDIEDENDEEKVQLVLKTFHNIRSSEVNTRIKLFPVKSPEILKPIIQS